MKIPLSNKIVASVLLLLCFMRPVYAQEFLKDLSLSPEDVRVETSVLKGERVRIYVTVRNNSYFDLSGVVKFYNEKTSQFIAADQPISVLAQKTDDVYIDWDAEILGEHPIAIRVVPWDEDGDNPNNNKLIKKVYVDKDSDGDGIMDSLDSDDDNDGVPDNQDAFPLDPRESKDTDGDGTGNNADSDDDNDGVLDVQDAFPLNPNETKDTDGDGTGDNGDLFPYDSSEWMDSDGDGLGDNADPDDANHGPIPFIKLSDTKVRMGKSLTFNALESRDPDGQITKFEWDFGDGAKDTGVIIDHIFENTGEYIVTLTVTDDHGESRQQQIQIKVKLDFLTLALIITTILLILLILGLLIPGSRFHHKKMRMHWKSFRNN